jgi:hypothetical protein
MIEVRLPDGRVAKFPDNTPPDKIRRMVRRYLRPTPAPVAAQPGDRANAEPSLSSPSEPEAPSAPSPAAAEGMSEPLAAAPPGPAERPPPYGLRFGTAETLEENDRDMPSSNAVHPSVLRRSLRPGPGTFSDFRDYRRRS